MNQWCCRWSPTIGDLECGQTATDIWGTKDYVYEEDKYKPTVFFGLYHIFDYLSLWKHKGRRAILWAGSDLESLSNGYLFSSGKLLWLSKLFRGIPKFFLNFLKNECENWVEDEYEKEKLDIFGIKAKICPSFMGKIEDYPISYKWSEIPNVYVSAHEGRQEEYGFILIEDIAGQIPEVKFHLYGAEWESRHKNVICHGRIPKEQFNEEIKMWQCGLRLNETDGFSEITCKSILMGQYPITRLLYPAIPNFRNNMELIKLLKSLRYMKCPNIQGRNYYFQNLNRFPWVK